MARSDLSEWELVKAVGSNQEYDGLINYIIIEGFVSILSVFI